MPRLNPNDLEDPYPSTPEPEDHRRGAGQHDVLRQEVPSLFYKIGYTGHLCGLQGYIAPFLWFRDWKEYFYPPDGGPNIMKKYEVRPVHPVRIFFPSKYDQTSPQTLPALFTIHGGGGFLIGSSRDDDEWNRHFADTQNVLVISLDYSHSPWAPFPTAVHDIEALILAALGDESLPIDRSPRTDRNRHGLSRTAILGFSAGGNLALAASQLPTIRGHPNAPAAAISVYGNLDMSVPAHKKLANRPFKPTLSAPRGKRSDPLVKLLPSFAWSYVPYGHDLRDPLLSPAYASRDKLPPYVGLFAAELDILAHESWRLACRLAREGQQIHSPAGAARRAVPERRSKDVKMRVCGREEVGKRRGALDDEAVAGPGEHARFAFEENWDDGGVKWVLVPDVLHGFDNPHVRASMGGNEETVMDAQLKAAAYVAELGKWLRGRVWRL